MDSGDDILRWIRDNFFLIVVIVLPWLGKWFKRLKAQKQETSWTPDPYPAPPPVFSPPRVPEPYPGTPEPYPGAPEPYPGAPEPYPGAAAPSLSASDGLDEWARARRDDRFSRIERLKERAAELGAAVLHERANLRFWHTLTEYVPTQLRSLEDDVGRDEWSSDPDIDGGIADAALVVGEIDVLVRQRRDPVVAAQLGDVDRVADACYQPIVEFARSRGLPLTTGWPAAQRSEWDLAIWTGFVPTSIAPIFLPRDFFRRVAWWPAIAHEIGHDFFASVTGLDGRLRRDLGLPGEEAGTRPLRLVGTGLAFADIRRLFGGWFEELFCDVFATLMCGPAYLCSMLDLFAAPGNPRRVLAIAVDAQGMGYDTHPPRHLRVLVALNVLARAGLSREAEGLVEEWKETHGFGDDASLRVVAPSYQTTLALPLEPFVQILGELVERLYAGPLGGLEGFGLAAVSGLDYGPHEHAEAARARKSFLAEEVPTVRDARALVAGAVLAAHEKPEQEVLILALLRRAIPAMGTSERRLDGYSQDAPTGAGTLSRGELVDALVLHAVLSPAPGARRSGRRRPRAGL